VAYDVTGALLAGIKVMPGAASQIFTPSLGAQPDRQDPATSLVGTLTESLGWTYLLRVPCDSEEVELETARVIMGTSSSVLLHQVMSKASLRAPEVSRAQLRSVSDI